MPGPLRRPAVVVPVVVVLLALAGVGLYLFQPWRLVTDVTVNEAFPTPGPAVSAAATPTAPSSAAPSSAAPPSAGASTPAAPSAEAAATTPVTVATGEFISHEHGTTGRVRVVEREDGSRVLRIEDLDTSNGPDLKVWLAAAPVIEGTDGWFVFDDDEYVDLGPLKGNRGNQNYPIPDGVDLERLSSVAIWCDRFSVSFGAAALAPAAEGT